MGLIIQQRALQVARLAVAYGYFSSTRVAQADIALDQVCAMSWRLSGR